MLVLGVFFRIIASNPQLPSQYSAVPQLADTPTSVFIRDFPLISEPMCIQWQLVEAQGCC